MSELGQFLLVELEPGHSRLAEAFIHEWAQLAHVVSVTDLAAISQTTLDVILMQPTERLKREEPKLYRAMQRKRQPQLPLNGRGG